MDFFDELSDNVVKAAKTVGKKAEKTANNAKIRFSLANLQSELDEHYEKLGKLHYENSRGDDVPEKEEVLFKKIESVRADMELLKEELARSKGAVICLSCKKNVSAELSFCPYCGKKIK